MVKLPYATVAFLDFLGFREMVKMDTSAAGVRYLPAILNVLDSVERRASAAGLSVTQFSDCVVVSGALKPRDVLAILEGVRAIQGLLIEKGILVRGGVAFGRHYERDGRLFSKALVKAYELESSRARVPRVVVDRNLLDWLVHLPGLDVESKRELASLLVKDRDGEVFVGYLDKGLLSRHAEVVTNLLETVARGRRDVMAKAHWLVDYHQYVAEECGEGRLDERAAMRFGAYSG